MFSAKGVGFDSWPTATGGVSAGLIRPCQYYPTACGSCGLYRPPCYEPAQHFNPCLDVIWGVGLKL